MLEVPILKQGDILVASVQAALSDKGLIDLQNRLAHEVVSSRVRGVIIDVTVLDVLDSFSARMLTSIAKVIKLHGARTVIVGIQPEVAIAMVRLGLTLTGVETALDLDDGLVMLSQREREHSSVWQSLKKPASRRQAS